MHFDKYLIYRIKSAWKFSVKIQLCTLSVFYLLVLIQPQTSYIQGVVEEMHPFSYHALSWLYIFNPSELLQNTEAKLYPELTLFVLCRNIHRIKTYLILCLHNAQNNNSHLLSGPPGYYDVVIYSNLSVTL